MAAQPHRRSSEAERIRGGRFQNPLALIFLIAWQIAGLRPELPRKGQQALVVS
jgi:hypothetical protein